MSFTFSFDLDDIFAFEAPRTVKLRDRKLGMLNLCFTAAIFGYSFIYLLIVQKQYRQEGSVTGTVGLSFIAPFETVGEPPEALSYCASEPCRYLDAYDAGRVENGAAFLTTRALEWNETLAPGCEALDRPECRNWRASNTSSYYVAQPEMFVLQVSHSIAVPSFDHSWDRTPADMSGRLCSSATGDCKPLDPCQPFLDRDLACNNSVGLGILETADQIPLEAILEAADIESLGMGLDSLRDSGVVLLVSINYDNPDYNEGLIRYSYRISQIKGADYRVNESVAPVELDLATEASARKIVSRSGIRLAVKQSGVIGRFDARTFLLTAVTSLGLLAVAKSIVIVVALQCLPLKHIYRQMRTYVSPDFSDIASLPQRQLDLFAYVDLVNPSPSVFQEVISEHKAGGSVGTTLKYAGSNAQDARTPRGSTTTTQVHRDGSRPGLIERTLHKQEPTSGFFSSIVGVSTPARVTRKGDSDEDFEDAPEAYEMGPISRNDSENPKVAGMDDD